MWVASTTWNAFAHEAVLNRLKERATLLENVVILDAAYYVYGKQGKRQKSTGDSIYIAKLLLAKCEQLSGLLHVQTVI